tara:strand:- start:700 stop:1458 length:759 start_codon:yes stop_codon:yes gene_type:complete
MQCDGCDRWCHGECAGVDEHMAKQLEFYICPRCELGEKAASALSSKRAKRPPPRERTQQSQGQPPDPPNLAYYGDGLDVKLSTIPNARNGLFVAREMIHNGDLITEYVGSKLLTKSEAADLKIQTHVATVSNGHAYIAGLRNPEVGKGAASFVNDCFNCEGFKYNAKFCKHPQYMNRLFIRATRDLHRGEEIFVRYGNRAIAMGDLRMTRETLPNGDTVFKTVVAQPEATQPEAAQPDLMCHEDLKDVQWDE